MKGIKGRKMQEDMRYKEKNFPLVSIITPSFNQGEFIRETIESVLNQDYPNIEYIVIDGGSTDNTLEILKEYDGQIRWISEKDNGQADAINKGITLTRGEIIGWINSDDIYMENAVSKLVEYWMNNPEADMVYGDAIYIDRKGNYIDKYLTEEFDRQRLAEECIICQPAAFFSRAIVEKIGMLDVEYQLGMDYDLWMRIAKGGKILYTCICVAASRMYDENKTLSRRRDAYIEACKAVKRNYGYVPASWTRGYAFYLCKEKRTFKFFIMGIYFFIKYNWDNPLYMVKERKKLKEIL